MIVCDNVPFVKKLECIEEMMNQAQTGYPYKGAKEHYILDIDDVNLCQAVITKLEKITPIPKPRKKK